MRRTHDGQYPNGKGHYTGSRGEGGNRRPKRRYPTRTAARKGLLRRLVRDWLEMGTYPCTGGDNELHYHFGHSTPRERWDSWKDLQAYRFKYRVLVRYYEARRRVRYFAKGGTHTGAHKKKPRSPQFGNGWRTKI